MSFHLLIGPMFAGKSTEMMRLARNYSIIGKNILAVNHSFNKRYGSDKITSHNKIIWEDCIILSHEKFNESDVIIIDELQFFQNVSSI
jgi:thymidine kinase